MSRGSPNTSAADRLRQARIRRGFGSAKAAARFFGFNENTYSLHEGGTRGIGRVYERYAEAFKVPPSWLLLGEGDPGWKDDAAPVEVSSQTLRLDRDLLVAAFTFVLQGVTGSERQAQELAHIAVDSLAAPPIEELDLDPVRSFRVRYRLERQKSVDPAQKQSGRGKTNSP